MVAETFDEQRPSRTNNFESRLMEIIEATNRGDLERIVTLLEEEPELLDEDVSNRHDEFKLGEAGTPLHVAAWFGHIEIAKYLLDRGADINKKNRWGRTPLHYAQEAGSPEMREFLVERGAELDIWAAAIRGDISRLNELLAEDPALANATQTNLSPLGWAAFGKQVEEVARLLIAHGANSHGRHNGMFQAIAVNNPPFVRVLLEHDADPNAADNVENRQVLEGMTLLHWATKMEFTDDNSESVRLLLEHGSDVNALDQQGKTPLDLALAAPGDDDDPHPSAPGQEAKRYDKLVALLREFGGKIGAEVRGEEKEDC